MDKFNLAIEKCEWVDFKDIHGVDFPNVYFLLRMCVSEEDDLDLNKLINKFGQRFRHKVLAEIEEMRRR